MQKWKRVIGAMLVLTLYASWVGANDDIIETESVKVTVNRVEQELHDTNISAAVITDDDLKRKPNHSVADMLQGIPGVTLEDGGMAGGQRVSIRGEGSTRVLVLIDGVKISEQKSMSGAAILIDPSDIERIEVIKGPASVLYGSEAIGGVINIITKKGGDKPIGGSTKLTYDSSTNSFEPYGAIGGGYEGFNYRVSGSYIDADDRDTPHGHIDKTRYRTRNWAAKVGYDWNWGSIFGGMDYYKNDIGLTDVKMPRYTIEMDLPKWERTTYRAGLELNNFSDYLLKISISGYYQNMKKDFANDMLGVMGTPSSFVKVSTENNQDSYGLSLQTEWLLLDTHYVIFGLDYNRDNLTADTFTLIRPPVPLLLDWYNYQKGHLETLGVFLQDEWSILDNLKIVAGLRGTWIKSKLKHDDAYAILFPTFVIPKVSTIGTERDSNWVGNIGLVYNLNKELSLRANVAQGYRFPTMNQLYIGTTHGGQNTFGNPNLKPEKSINYEIGARYNGNSWNADAAIFYADARDYITTKYVGPGFMGDNHEFTNLDKAKTWGFELSADYTFQPLGLTPYLAFTYIQRETNDSGFKTKKTDLAPFQGQFGIQWQQDLFEAHTFFADLNYTYNSHSKYAYIEKGSKITEKNDSWGTVNLSMGFESNHTDSINYFGTLSLRNLLDKSYSYSRSRLEQPGFHAVAMFGVSY